MLKLKKNGSNVLSQRTSVKEMEPKDVVSIRKKRSLKSEKRYNPVGERHVKRRKIKACDSKMLVSIIC